MAFPGWYTHRVSFRPQALVANSDGHLELFGNRFISTPGGHSVPQLGHLWQTSPGSGWSDWDLFASFPEVDATVIGMPVVLSSSAQRITLFSGRYSMAQVAPNSGWGPWQEIKNISISPIPVWTAASNRDGPLEIFSCGDDPDHPYRNIYHAVQQSTEPNSNWSDWVNTNTPQDIQIDPYSLIIVNNSDGRLEAFVGGFLEGGLDPKHPDRGGGPSCIFHTWQTKHAAGSAWQQPWSGWKILDSQSSPDLFYPNLETYGSAGALPERFGPKIAVASNSDGRLEAFVVDRAGSLWHDWQTSPNGNWSGWSSLGSPGEPLSRDFAPIIAPNGLGEMDVFVAGSQLWHISQVGANGDAGWSGWDALSSGRAGSLLGCPPVAATNTDGRIELFCLARDPEVLLGPHPQQYDDWVILHRWQLSPGGPWSTQES